MPALGATGGDVVMDEWHVKVGDYVKAGAPLCTVTTDKASVEVEAFRDGYVRELRAEPGASVAIGAVVAVLADSMNEPLEAVPVVKQAPEAVPGPVRERAAPAPAKTTGRTLASPLARRMAKEEGIDLAGLRGSGRQGQVLRRDVMAAMSARQMPQPAPAHTTGGVRREPLSPMRRAIAARTQQSKAAAPHFYAAITIDMTAARALRKLAAAEAEKHGWQPPTLTDLVIRASALALRRTPSINASLEGDAIVTYDDVNIGLVVGLPEGMLIPVIHRADRLNLFTLAGVTRRLKDRAAAGELAASELGGATFTLSNLGMFGLDSFVAIINPPEAGVLTLGAVAERPAVRAGRIVARWQMIATLSVDHRLVDGISAARYMAELKQLLENPVRLALDAPEAST